MAMDQQVTDRLEVQGLKKWGGQGIGSNNNGGAHHGLMMSGLWLRIAS